MYLLDNTLRDGEQTPGVLFSKYQKEKIVEMLCEVGIEHAEVGFPAVSQQERDCVKSVVDRKLPITAHALCRPSRADVSIALECGVRHLTVFVPTNSTSRHALFGTASLEAATPMIQDVIAFACQAGASVKFSCEHASLHGMPALLPLYGSALEAGAHMLSFADTSGLLTPDGVRASVALLKSSFKVPLSVHFHNDLGLATANTVIAGAEGVEELQVCVNGLGERAGNAPLEEVAVVLSEKMQLLPKLNYAAMRALSLYVYEITRLSPAFNKPFWGENVYSHESGIHVAAIEEGNEYLYNAVSPKLFGLDNRVILGKHMGLANIKYFNVAHNLGLSRDQMKDALAMIKDKLNQDPALGHEQLLGFLDSFAVESSELARRADGAPAAFNKLRW